MTAEALEQVLAATGYLPDGQPATGLYFDDDARSIRRSRNFRPDALWRSPSSLTVYFKYEPRTPDNELVSQWHREIWNEGFAPLLWIVSPTHIDLYNGFSAPQNKVDAEKHLIRSFENIETSLSKLDELAGRLSIETGQFWTQATEVNRKTSVDHKLLSDLAFLEHDLVNNGLARDTAQALIGRVIFTQYLIDRNIVTVTRLRKLCGHTTLSSILRDRNATGQLFSWLSDTFNGDMFPQSSVKNTPAISHLKRVANFLDAVDPVSGQQNFFPYQFDIIPVELISSIYEQFAHANPKTDTQRSEEAIKNGVHYTRLPLVSMVLDEVMNELSGDELVLDLTCGSGVFLVEALRRLVHIRSGEKAPTRSLIRSILYEQIYGVDISEAAVRIAAFSLYLAALELDPNPTPPHALKFRPLIGKTLLVGDARTIEKSGDGKTALTTNSGVKEFDLVIGNPPWSFKGQTGTEARRKTRTTGTPAQPRGEGLDFVSRAIEFSHPKTRFGIVLSAMPFFSRSDTGMAAARHIIQRLAPITLVNLSNMSSWLFATATMPAVVLFARHKPKQRTDQLTVVQIPWTPSSVKTHSFEVAPSDIIKLTTAEIERQPLKLKAAAVGRRRDLLLLETLTSEYPSLNELLDQINTRFRDGLIQGKPKNQIRDASSLQGMRLLQSKDMRHFCIPSRLPIFDQSKAQWPRSRDTYRAPLLIVKEMLAAGPRALTAFSERDLVFTDAYFATHLPPKHKPAGRLLTVILSSALASWFFALTGSEFGIYKRKLLARDVGFLPIPEFKHAIECDAGQRLLQVEKELKHREITSGDWKKLDEAVFDLYQLDEHDRVVIRDGLTRAGWQWERGRKWSAIPANNSEIVAYTEVFLSVINGWLSIRNKRYMRAEVFDLPEQSPLRVVRFILEDNPGRESVDVVTANGKLNDILSSIGKRMKVKIASALTAQRELRIHGRNEVVVIKPAAHRHWMGIAALEDADTVVAESFAGGNA